MKNFNQFKNLFLVVTILCCPYLSDGQTNSNKKFEQILKKLERKNWTMLFNGSDFSGWEQREGKAPFVIENGIITGTAKEGTPSSFLCTEKDYGDFILELYFKTDRWMNSGIQIRSDSRPDYKNGEVFGYQVEIDPSERSWSGGIYDQSRRGWIGSLEGNDAARNAFNPNDWNHFRIIAIGPYIKTWINGIPAADIIDYESANGFIALQLHLVHNDGASAVRPGAQIQWKNIKIKYQD